MRRRRLDPFDRRSMALSVAFHASLFALGWASTMYEPPELTFITYEIELVSPPPAVQSEEPTPATEEIVVERPDPTPPEPEPEEIVPVEEAEPEPPPEEVEQEPEEAAAEVAEAAALATAAEAPEEEPEVSGEALNVRIEGLRRDYPQYYENIIRQIRRCFRWREGGSWSTTVQFYIDREGNVDARDIQFVSRSGSAAFDFTSMEAVECAGQGRFGPLPEDLPYDRFPVRFRFSPVNAPLDVSPEGGALGWEAQTFVSSGSFDDR